MDSKLYEFNRGLENGLPFGDEVVGCTLEQFSVFVLQLRKCEFIKTVCSGLCSMLTLKHEIVLLKYLITGLLTLKYYSGHIAGDKG